MTLTHLRIALFGNVQVYGSRPGQPINNGLFDYSKNVQLINTGIRVMKKASPPKNGNATTLGRDLINGQQQTDDVESQLYKSIISNHTETDESEAFQSLISSNANSHKEYKFKSLDINSNHKKKQRKKTPEDRHIEFLIRKIAAITHNENNKSNGILDNFIRVPDTEQLRQHVADKSRNNFELDANTYKIRFSLRVPTSYRLAGSFDHPHYPICHRIVALMKCKPLSEEQKQQKELTYYSTVKISLESHVNMHSAEYQKCVQTEVVYQHMNSRSLFYNYMLSSSSTLSSWVQRLLHSNQKRTPIESQETSPSRIFLSSYLRAYAEIHQQVFLRSQFIPLQIKLDNHTQPHFSITVIKITIDFLRRIFMTCSLSEEVEKKLITSKCVEFSLGTTRNDAEAAASFSHLFEPDTRHCFDLSKVLKIPEDCSCTIAPETTKQVYGLGYDLEIRIEVSGVLTEAVWQSKSANLKKDIAATERIYVATDKQITTHPEFKPYTPYCEPYYHKLKKYTLQLRPLNVAVANSTC
ncbi:hypothetical protein BDF20DRAFT_850275 [Mycotypha africana]|uniref:uncharacterized protein n=1 Tax=Mycotypha africana TaxID=64632 RepID=UPI0023011CF8|nr:uncharacterized protein BDF20DRAFT_850275 [Mycotypha africana]KAI8987433.1 hypothetical protein BDF20DRAFT_850275 [Mycotypha africana]